MFEAYWDAHEEDYIQISYANERLSYFVKNTGDQNGIWFVHEELENAIREIHSFVRNAVVKDRCVVVGTGSTQLFQAAVYALSNPSLGRSTAVVASVPYYSVSKMYLLCYYLEDCSQALHLLQKLGRAKASTSS